MQQPPCNPWRSRTRTGLFSALCSCSVTISLCRRHHQAQSALLSVSRIPVASTPSSWTQRSVRACKKSMPSNPSTSVSAGRVVQLGHRLGLDLPDPFPGDPVDLPDLIQGPRLAVGEPKNATGRCPLPARTARPARLQVRHRDRRPQLWYLVSLISVRLTGVATDLREWGGLGWWWGRRRGGV
jgi:hypothetical protein